MRPESRACVRLSMMSRTFVTHDLQEPMVLSCNQIINCEMVEHLGFDNLFKKFAEDAGEAYWPINNG